MAHDPTAQDSARLPQTAFQRAVCDVLEQRVEAITHEVRAIGTAEAGIFASGETLGMLAAVLQNILRRIDEIFEMKGFVFTPACSLLLELFQARIRGAATTIEALCQSANCPASVTGRWVNVLESMQLVQKIDSGADDPKIALTERGYLKTIEALKLLI